LAGDADELEARRNDLVETSEAEAVYAPEDRARAGVIMTIGDDGEFRLYEGLVERTACPSHADGCSAEAEDDNEPFASGAAAAAPSPRPLTAEQQVRKACGLSQLLVDDLKAHRLQIARAHLAGDFGVAFDLVLYALCSC
jgi:ParB family transcriptional regulator, chromosome partitioning protein